MLWGTLSPKHSGDTGKNIFLSEFATKFWLHTKGDGNNGTYGNISILKGNEAYTNLEKAL